MRPALATTILLVSTILVSWLGMQIVHELGHVVAAMLTGGTVTRVVLHPLTISRTDVAPNPHPLLVVWSGPLLGTIVPLLTFAVAHYCKCSAAYLFRFFAGFCCIANGAYIGTGVIFPVGDAHLMRMGGSPSWVLALFGAMTIPLGLWLWNGLGPSFGLGPKASPVNSRHAVTMAMICFGSVVLEIVLT